jgi:hypothetical protein
MKQTDYLKYYHLEEFLFNDVSNRFRNDGCISAFDFFCIVIWKANRAKSKIAKRLLSKGDDDLDSAVKALTKSISEANQQKDRLQILMNDWGFRLPMASAILTVLYPEQFTIYDVRVCETLQSFQDTQHKKPFDKLWESYEEYIKSVKMAVTEDITLRDKDRWLWGKSFASQLQKSIENKFPGKPDDCESET